MGSAAERGPSRDSSPFVISKPSPPGNRESYHIRRPKGDGRLFRVSESVMCWPAIRSSLASKNGMSIAQLCDSPSVILSTFCRWLPPFPAMSKTEPATDGQPIGLFKFCARLVSPVTSHVDGFFLRVQPVGHQHPVPCRQGPPHTLRRSNTPGSQPSWLRWSVTPWPKKSRTRTQEVKKTKKGGREG